MIANFLVDLLTALAVGMMFVALGELLLFRPCRNVSSAFESLVVGAGAAAALLFPLSLLAGPRALGLLLGMLVLALVTAVALRFGRWKRLEVDTVRRSIDWRDPLSVLLLCLIVAASICFALLNWRMAYLWDGFQIWASRAQMLFIEGRLAPERFPETLHVAAKIRYPPLISMYEALTTLVRGGGFDFDRFKPIFLVLFLGMVALTYEAGRRVAGSRSGLIAAALVALLPPLSMGSAAGGYADMPLAFFVAALTSAILADNENRRGFSATPWLMGALCMVKDEGLVLSAIAVMTTAGYWLMTASRVPVWARLRKNVAGIFIVAGMIVSRVAYLRWLDYQDSSFLELNRETFSIAMQKIPEVAAIGSRYVFDPKMWGLFWPAFLASTVIILFMRCDARVRAISLSVLLAAGAFFGIFLYTKWELALHIDQALPRLLAQIAPAAAVVMVAAYETAFDSRARTSVEAARSRA